MKKIIYKLNELSGEHGYLKGIAFLIAKVLYLMMSMILDTTLIFFVPINKNRILFESGTDYSDNAKALFEYLIKENYNKKYEFIWLINEPHKIADNIVYNTRFIKKLNRFNNYSIRSYYYARTSKILFFTHSNAWLRKKREKQKVVNLWHGCGYKGAKGSTNKIVFDYCLVPGSLFVETKSIFFKKPIEAIIPLGYPRYDWIFRLKSQISDLFPEMKKKILTNKNILWMPTFRTSTVKILEDNTLDSTLGLPIINTMQELFKINDYCKLYGINIFIKSHRLDDKLSSLKNISELTNIVFFNDEILVEKKIEMYDLLSRFDGLITDYSSIAFDYMLVDKPIGFTLDDYEKYKMKRGFVFDNPLVYMPGNHIYSTEDFVNYLSMIKNGDDFYSEERAKVIKLAHTDVECKEYSKKLVDFLDL